MIHTNKIRGKMAESRLTIQAVAPQMGITPYTLGKKISNDTPMTLNEALTFSEILNIPKESIADYFFYNQSCKTQQN